MSQTLSIGFIGLGNMGLPIAKNLLAAGFSVTVYNRTAAKAEPLKSIGAHVVSSSPAAASNADVVITMLSDDAALKEVCSQVLPAMKAGAIHFSMSTIAPATVDELQTLHKQYNVQYVAAPVLGRPPAAEARQLFVLLSGSDEAKQKIMPVVNAVAQRSFDFGGNVSVAHAVKLALNLMVFTSVELLSELMVFAEKTGIDKSMLMDTINNTSFGSPLLKLYGQLVLAEKDNPNGFATTLANKDIRLAQETAATVGLELPLANLIRSHFEETIAEGNGGRDVSLLVEQLRRKLAI